MLTVLCFRSEETAHKPFLQALLDRAGRDLWSAISLEPMTESEAHTLIDVLLPADSALTDQDREPHDARSGWQSIRARAVGSLRRASTGSEPSQAPTFATMFESRLGALSPDARGFLETLAICGRPMSPDAHLRRVRHCARSAIARRDAPLVPLDSQQRLVGADRDVSRSDSRGAGRARRLPTRCGGFTAASCGRSSSGAVTTARRCSSTIKARATRRTRAIQAGLAAEKAGAALAFDRAASFYRHALGLTPASSAAHTWQVGLAHALANAGRPAEAAEAYLAAAADAGRAERVELLRRGGGAIPDRRAHRSRSGSDPHRPRGSRHAFGPKLARRAVVALVAARAAAMARAALCLKVRRRTSTPTCSCASTPAGRRQPDWRSWTSSARWISACAIC